MSAADRQTSSHVMMIRPVAFAGNPQTRASNAFQQVDPNSVDSVNQAAALREFDGLAHALDKAGVTVHTFEDTPDPHTPDSIFPNNWVSFHADGTVVLYPMLAENRRLERRLDLIEALSAKHGFHVARVIDLTRHEHTGRYLEGTGSLVLDRMHRVAYACVSPRTDLDVLGDFAQQLDYDIVAFEANDANGKAIYHTNVLMSVGERFAAVCLSAIREDERDGVLNQLRGGGRVVVDLSHEQMNSFAGNMLELGSSLTGSVIAMSEQARGALTAEQRATLESHAGPIVATPIPTIEKLGGGSVRCMLAELHLPMKKRL
ncbi:citrulline utilization hydrolase CtlX [Peristeroidobacter soli]|uniref:citrulline utilization hydrolase CtlX n=1 Tax=Peristeroidobacter soli TaxID=2497877 RepID=UPI001C37D054|nr:arginine deiminase-related protein [Peristeroidobacter soli]